MTVRLVAMGVRGLAALALGIPPALAASPGPYAGFEQSAYLAYLNAPAPGGDLTRPPRLRISFGGRSYAVVVDTGSTGIVVSADKIPNIDRLKSLGPGQLTYSSSGRVMIGRWVVTPVTVMGRNGVGITTAPIPVLAVDRVECTDNARRCTPREAPRGISPGATIIRRKAGRARIRSSTSRRSTAARRGTCGAAISLAAAASLLG